MQTPLDAATTTMMERYSFISEESVEPMLTVFGHRTALAKQMNWRQ